MTIEEMHIAVNLGVQKIASFQVDNLLPQEIDHELNNAMHRFIKQRYPQRVISTVMALSNLRKG